MSIHNTPTPHNAGKYGDIAETVIMAGDPVRIKYIAENYLDNPVLYNQVRGALGYTGTYKGKRVSVQAHGMGIPSIGIYSWELYNFYDVKRIIRVGTCGSYKSEVKLGSIILAEGACTDSGYGTERLIPGKYSAIADFDLLRRAVENAEKDGVDYEVGNILSSDVFYNQGKFQDEWTKLGVLGVEMEAYALYMNAALTGNKALTVLTVTDNIATGEELTSDERALGMDKMIRVALETA